MNEASLLARRTQINDLGNDLFDVCGIEISRTSEIQRQICGAFLFGMAFAYAKQSRLPPPEVHALAITMLQDSLGYSAEQSGAFSERLIRATSTSQNDSTKAIIHRGIDGYRQLESNQQKELRENILGIFKTLNVPYVA